MLSTLFYVKHIVACNHHKDFRALCWASSSYFTGIDCRSIKNLEKKKQRNKKKAQTTQNSVLTRNKALKN